MFDAKFITRMLASGGDHRIWVANGANTNMYGSSPFPRATLGYASSTANDISRDAYMHLQEVVSDWPLGAVEDAGFYANALNKLRSRIQRLWDLPKATDVVFAPSGTDLEFVALAMAKAGHEAEVSNILLGQDEVGSGCVLSAAGRYFAPETALVSGIEKGAAVAGFDGTSLHDVPVRDPDNRSRTSAEICADIDRLASEAEAAGRICLAHVVYGSKTGLVLPELGDLEQLRADHPNLRLVIDACQVRIDGDEVRTLLGHGCMVLLTGSKFIGGPPFCGFALVPEGWNSGAEMPQGLDTLFRRAEWPSNWAGLDHLPQGSNPGLLLRLEAAIFELERFTRLPMDRRGNVITAFGDAMRALAERLGVNMVEPCLDGDALYRSTLVTMDLTGLPSAPNFEVAQRWHKVLAARGFRLGQPVKCVHHPEGGWGGTLRLSLSMPLIVELAKLDETQIKARLAHDMDKIAQVLEAAQRSVAA